jgi:hypothetical protein
VPNVRPAKDRLRQPSDGDRPATSDKRLEETHRLSYFELRRPSVRLGLARVVRMSRHDVPEQDVVLEPELGKGAVDDRRGRLRWAGSGELMLGRERHAAHSRAPIARRLSHEQVTRRLRAQVLGEPSTSELRAGVLVEGRADLRVRELLDEPADVQAASRR